MEKKDLRKTEGLPLYLGIASGIFALISTIININVKPLIMSALIKSEGLATTINPVNNLVESIIGYVIYPGIFLILLFAGKNRPKRGKVFGIVWMALSILSLLSSLSYNFLRQNKMLQITENIINTVVPGGMALYVAIDMLGCGLMIASCIVFLLRFRKPEAM